MTKTNIQNNFDFYRLKNRVRVMLVPMAGVQSIAVGVYVQAGSRYETVRNNGISHFLEHMVFKGTKNFPTHQDTSYLEGLGAIQNAWTSSDATCFYCKIPSDKWRQGLDVIKDLVLYPSFPKKDLETERGVILEEINRRDDRPDEISDEVLMGMMYKGNALGFTTLGTPEVIKRVVRDDFLEYHTAQYTPDRLVVTLAGKLPNPEDLRGQIEDWFGGLPKVGGRDFEPLGVFEQGLKIETRYKKLAQQAHLQMGFRGINVNDPRRFALTLLSVYLGQGLSSRLFKELREKRGLCYVVHAGDEKFVDTGVWSVYAGVGLDKLDESIGAIWGEIKRLREIVLDNDELMATKEKIRGPMLFSLENPIHQMEFYARQALDRPDEIRTQQEIVDRVMQIDAEMIRNVAVDLFSLDKLRLAIVGQVEDSQKERLVDIITT